MSRALQAPDVHESPLQGTAASPTSLRKQTRGGTSNISTDHQLLPTPASGAPTDFAYIPSPSPACRDFFGNPVVQGV